MCGQQKVCVGWFYVPIFFLLILRTYRKSHLIYKFLWKCDICYIGCTIPRSKLRINQHIPLAVHTNNFNYSAVSSNQNSTSAIAQHLLDNPMYSTAYNLRVFCILKNWTNELHLSVFKALLITKFWLVLCKQNKFYKLLLFNTTVLNSTTPNRVCEENKIICTNSFGLQWYFFLFSFLPSPPQGFSMVTNPVHFLSTTCLSLYFSLRYDQKEGFIFFRILKYFKNAYTF